MGSTWQEMKHFYIQALISHRRILTFLRVNATTYPYLQLKMRNVDTANYTPYQLSYWRINYVGVPEGAIAPNIYFQMDTAVDVGQPINFKIAFKNVSDFLLTV